MLSILSFHTRIKPRWNASFTSCTFFRGLVDDRVLSIPGKRSINETLNAVMMMMCRR